MTTETRLCLECQRCELEEAEPGYSDRTPGRGLTLKCLAAHWRLDPYTAEKGQLAGWLRQAVTCQDFFAVGETCAVCGSTAFDRTTFTTCVDCGTARKEG